MNERVKQKLICPLCGSAIQNNREGLGVTSELLGEICRLKEKGVLTEAMFVAVKLVQSMDDNPALLRRLLEEQRGLILSDVKQQISPLQQALWELKGSPQTIGKAQEVAIAKRLSALKIGQDTFSTEKSSKASEDVTCSVKNNAGEIGKIIIESKRTRKWSESFIEQIKGYMEKTGTEFGIIATTALPDDALSYSVWRHGVLIVRIDYLEASYLFLREYLILKRSLEEEYATKLRQLEIKDQLLQELEGAIRNGELDQIIGTIDTVTLAIDQSISRAEHSITLLFRGITKNTRKIRELTAKLISDHIGKIRTQLVGSVGLGSN